MAANVTSRRLLAGLLAVVVLALPAASATTEPITILEDPAADVEPVGPGSPHMDVRALRVEPAEAPGLSSTMVLEVTQILASEPAVYEVTFESVSLASPSFFLGALVEADLTGTEPVFQYYLQTNAPATRDSSPPLPLEGRVEPGSPGRVEWEVAGLFPLILPYGAVYDFAVDAKAASAAPLGSAVHDSAADPDAFYLVPPPVALEIGNASIPSRDPDATISAARGAAPSVFRHMWVEADANGTTVTWTAEADPENGCAMQASGAMYPRSRSASYPFHVSASIFRGRYEIWSSVINRDVPDLESRRLNASLAAGEPSLVVFSVHLANLTFPKETLAVHLQTMCSQDSGWSQAVYQGPRSRAFSLLTPAPGLAALFLALGLVGAGRLVARRRS